MTAPTLCKNCGEAVTRTWTWPRVWYHIDGSHTDCGPRTSKAEPEEDSATWARGAV